MPSNEAIICNESNEKLRNNSVDITLTDFIYGIVVGAAFQNIKQPIPSVGNAIILIALVIIIDDWVLYHAQSKNIQHTPNQFAKILFMDAGVLVTWFFATTYNASDISMDVAIEGFLFWIIIFYCLTCFWEWVFVRQTKNPARFYSDFGVILLISLCYMNRDDFNIAVHATCIFLLWIIIRAVAWRGILKPNIISVYQLTEILRKWLNLRSDITTLD